MSSDLDAPELPGAPQPWAGRSQGARGPAPLMKWPGGKTAELGAVLAAAPRRFDRYFEPFVGGGAVLFAMPPDVPAYVNDVSSDLVAFYRLVQQQDHDLFDLLYDTQRWWDRLAAFVEGPGTDLAELFVRGSTGDQLEHRAAAVLAGHVPALVDTVTPRWSDLGLPFAEQARTAVPRKLARMRAIERARAQLLPADDVVRNVEGALKAACYTTLRSAYNHDDSVGSARRAALFYFLREYAYAAMFRFNANGHFNVPYGGISYNRKNFRAKVDHLGSAGVRARLATTTVRCEDFEDFVEACGPGPDDFMFLDPPYDTDFSDYDAKAFGPADHERLAATMRRLTCRVQLVIKSTPAVLDLYEQPGWHVVAFDKRYLWTIKERNDRKATHLMITNYPPEGPPAACAAPTPPPG